MTENEIYIAEYLYKKIGNWDGVFGLMGNLKAESGCNPKNLQNSAEKKLGLSDEAYTKAVDNGKYTNFVHDSAGYGLAQWTYYSRKQTLLDFAKLKKKSIGDLGMQLEFLINELMTGYKSVWKGLTSAKSIKEASDIVLTKYEKPANQDDSVKKKRSGYGETYAKEYEELKKTVWPALEPGACILLENTDIYASSTTTKSAGKRNGHYYIYSSDVVKDRIKVTSKKNLVGVAGGVTGWINRKDVVLHEINYDAFYKDLNALALKYYMSEDELIQALREVIK